MTIEQMQKIVDGAPEWAKWWCKEKRKFLDFIPCSECVTIESLRTQLAKREPMDLRSVDIPHGTIVLEK